MGKDKDKRQDDLREARREGFERGYHLGRRMGSPHRGDRWEGEPEGAPYPRAPVELPLFIHEVLEIAHRRGVGYE